MREDLPKAVKKLEDAIATHQLNATGLVMRATGHDMPAKFNARLINTRFGSFMCEFSPDRGEEQRRKLKPTNRRCNSNLVIAQSGPSLIRRCQWRTH